MVVAGLLGVALVFWPTWHDEERRLFDKLAVLTAPGEADLPITLVAIDDESLGALGQWPWPRGTHANLLAKLKDAGVAIAAFDVVFAENDRDPVQDAAFAKAIRDFGGPVVLAASQEFRDTRYARQWVRVDPTPNLQAAGALTGLASVTLDTDGVLRKVPTSQGAFWLAIVTAFDKAHPGVVKNLSVTESDRIRYLGPPQTFTTIPYHRLLDPEKLLSPNWRDVLRDNIVIVGRVTTTAVELNLVESDMFRTPFTQATGLYTPGAEVQATIVHNMITASRIREADATHALLLVLTVTALSWFAMRSWSPLRSSVATVGLVGLVGALAWSLLQFQRVWLPAGAGGATAILAFVLEGLRSYLGEQARRAEIRRAFATYVSPALVDEIIANPDALKLGGDRRDITILFTDLAGFTSLAEKLPAEEVAALLNRHLSEMTDIVIAHGGTVDKFIGDAVMAFWGAPIADPEQSRHALEAAVAMQAATARFGAQLAKEGGPEIRMRVGLHRGECIVGNLGGNARFEYTAIGDAVNLASRLEGANNAYGTGILASDAVVDAVAGVIAVRPVDVVRVKGRSQPVSLYTPCDDAKLAASTAAALAHFRSGRWDDAAASYRAIANDWPDDPVARVFIARLEAWRESGWPADWDGVVTLASK